MKKHLLVLGLIVSMLFFAGCGSGGSGGGSGGGGNSKPGGGLPDVPSVSGGGSINESRGGAVVKEDNLEDFVMELLEAIGGFDDLDDYFNAARTRAKTRSESNLRELKVQKWGPVTETHDGKHGRIVTTISGEYGWDDVKDFYYAKGTAKVEIFDFSGNGKLYLGGAVGASFYMYESATEVSMEGKINGKINFNGTYQGVIEFRNLHASMSTGKVNPNIKGDVVIVSGGETHSLKKYLEELMNEFL